MDNNQILHYLYNNHNKLYTAIVHHKTHNNKNLTFQGMHYLKEIYLDESDYITIVKSTQCGITEWLMLNALLKASEGRSVFYVLPTYNIVSRFVKNRIDRTIENTPLYHNMKKKKYTKFSESMSLKHIGKGTIAFIGSNSSAGFTEFPADDLIIDELDECDQENLPMADERLSASLHKMRIKIGNPTIENYGIDDEYALSDKKQWHIKCSSCGEWILPDFFHHVVREEEDGLYVIRDEEWDNDIDRDIYALCDKCGKPYDRKVTGEWVNQTKSDISGYRISKMFSTNVKITELLDRFNKGLTSDSKMQRFYNGDLGFAFTSSGAKVSYDMLDECVCEYRMPASDKKVCIMGVDVGNKLHVEIGEKQTNGKIKMVFIGTVDSKRDIVNLYKRFNCKAGCVDALPEKRMSNSLKSLLKGMFIVFYSDTAKKNMIDIKRKVLTIDRTESLDAVKEAVMIKTIMLPMNAKAIAPVVLDNNGQQVSEFYFQMCTSTRIYDDKAERYKWVEGNKPDHYFHSMNYMLLANKLIVSGGK